MPLFKSEFREKRIVLGLKTDPVHIIFLISLNVNKRRKLRINTHFSKKIPN